MSHRERRAMEELNAKIENGVCTVVLSGKIDGATSGEIKGKVTDFLRKTINETELEWFVFDLNDVTFVSSRGLTMFSDISTMCKKNQIDYKLIGVRRDIVKIFQLTGYASVFKIEAKPETV